MRQANDPTVPAHGLGHEARALGADHAALKLWLRLLACTTQVEEQIRRRLRQRVGISLARVDYLAQLYRWPSGLKMKDLSRCLMVTGGNVTGLTDELAREGLVQREPSATDRRSWIVRLTAQGRDGFEAIAQEHEQWILELFGGLGATDIQQVHQQPGALRSHLAHRQDKPTEPAP